MSKKHIKVIVISVVAIVAIIVATIAALCIRFCNKNVERYVKITYIADDAVYEVYEDYAFNYNIPVSPQKEGAEFVGWYFDKEFSRYFGGIGDLSDRDKDIVLYAKFKCLHLTLSEETFEEATCIDGSCLYQLCYTCYERIVIEESLPLGHVGGEADCITRAVCTRCDNEYGALDAENHRNLVVEEAVDPTCDEIGFTEGRRCTACELVLSERKRIAAKGHRYVAVVTYPTCTKGGYTTHICSECNKSVEDTYVSALGHSQIVWVGELPTCTEIGFTDGVVCERCETVFEERKEISALGHVSSESYFYDGEQHWYACKHCGNALSEKYTHTITGTDTCVDCDYYIADEIFSGSAIKSIVRRTPISLDFENKAGMSYGTLEIVVIDIAQGDSIFIKFPDNQTMLMDGGSVNFPIGNHYDRIEAVLESYNIQQLDHLFITHSDYDHVRYLEDVLDDYQVKNIYIPKVGDDSNGRTWKSLVKAIETETYTLDGARKKSNVRYNIGDFEIAGDAWRMRCYSYLSKDYPLVNGSSASSPTAPDADDGEIINSLSPICFLEYAGRVIVLTGDSNEFNEKYLVERGVFDGLKADVLKVAHHGSKTSTTNAFLSAFECTYAVISYGTNVFGHPTSEVLSRLNAYGYKYVYKTKEDGSVRINVSGNGDLAIDAVKTDDKDISEKYVAAVMAQNYVLVADPRKRDGYSFDIAA